MKLFLTTKSLYITKEVIKLEYEYLNIKRYYFLNHNFLIYIVKKPLLLDKI
jgi:hypothetical protein